MFFYDRSETKRTGIGQFGEAAAVNLCDEPGNGPGRPDDGPERIERQLL